MEKEFQSAVGKSMGEVIRNISEFLSTPCVINRQKAIDLCTLLPELNMHEQFSYALLCEALCGGWSREKAAQFYTHACESVLGEAFCERILQAFRAPNGGPWKAYTKKYGNRFSLFDSSYWATALSLGIDCDAVDLVLQYLRLFTVTLMGFAYMEDRNPQKTYTWGYYESFRQMLDDFLKPTAKAPLPLKVRAVGGTAGKRTEKTYSLSLGVDLENPNPHHTARDIDLDITLKDKDGRVISVIKDRIFSIPPASLYHYGITRAVHGAATATLHATAKASSFQESTAPAPLFKLSQATFEINNTQTLLTGTLAAENTTPRLSALIHYQFLSADNQILGGGSVWCFDEAEDLQKIPLSASIPVVIKNADRVVLSSCFDGV